MPLDEKTLQIILYHIQKEQCVIFLGDELPINSEGKFLKELIYDTFSLENPDLKLDVDNFYFFDNHKNRKTKFAEEIDMFLRENISPLRFHKLIACMNFPLMITLTPDKILYKAFPEGTCKFNYYYYAKEPAEIDKISKKEPLVYNLFGSIDEPESILLTNEDLLEYLFGIIGGGEGAKSSIHSAVKTVLGKAKYFIFLGFDLDKWYIRILFKYFDLRQKSTGITRNPAESDEKHMMNFYVDNFEVKFLDASPVEIMEAIYQKALKEDTEKKTANYLRFRLSDTEEVAPFTNLSLSENLANTVSAIKTFVGQSDIKSALLALEKLINSYKKDLQNDVLLLKSRYVENENKCHENTIENDEYDREKAKIIKALLFLADQVLS